MIEKIYSHKNKVGHYRILFISVGAGISRGQILVIYQDIESGAIYHRSQDDFAVSMIEV